MQETMVLGSRTGLSSQGGQKGEIYSYTTIYEPPAGFEGQAPYTIALIKTDEGPLVTARLTDLDREDLKIGMHVEAVTRKISGPDGPRYLKAFRPPIVAR